MLDKRNQNYVSGDQMDQFFAIVEDCVEMQTLGENGKNVSPREILRKIYPVNETFSWDIFIKRLMG
jgi:hypothetical protein